MDLSFYLHMNSEYMWRWFGSDRVGNPVVISTRSFFEHADAVRDLERFRAGMSILQLAA